MGQQGNRTLAGFAQITPDAERAIEIGVGQGAGVEPMRSEAAFGLALRAVARAVQVRVLELIEILLRGTSEWV